MYVNYGASINWTEAENYCKKNYGTKLVSIHSAAQQALAYASMEGVTFAWIGLNDRTSEGNWSWSDGSRYDYDDNWGPHEPQGGTMENCVTIYDTYDGEWIDIDCNNVAVTAFICNLYTYDNDTTSLDILFCFYFCFIVLF